MVGDGVISGDAVGEGVMVGVGVSVGEGVGVGVSDGIVVGVGVMEGVGEGLLLMVTVQGSDQLLQLFNVSHAMTCHQYFPFGVPGAGMLELVK